MTEGSQEARTSPATLSSPPVPLRMLNEIAYCPRLGYLMWVQEGFADSVHTFRSWAVRGGGGNQVTSDG